MTTETAAPTTKTVRELLADGERAIQACLYVNKQVLVETLIRQHRESVAGCVDVLDKLLAE